MKLKDQRDSRRNAGEQEFLDGRRMYARVLGDRGEVVGSDEGGDAGTRTGNELKNSRKKTKEGKKAEAGPAERGESRETNSTAILDTGQEYVSYRGLETRREDIPSIL